MLLFFSVCGLQLRKSGAIGRAYQNIRTKVAQLSLPLKYFVEQQRLGPKGDWKRQRGRLPPLTHAEKRAKAIVDVLKAIEKYDDLKDLLKKTGSTKTVFQVFEEGFAGADKGLTPITVFDNPGELHVYSQAEKLELES